MENKLIRSKYFLYLTEFFAGMSVMAVELGASRLMAPYFSSSQIVWTVIIGVIMIAMAIGNVWGGKLADRSATPDKLYRRLIVAAIWIALIPFVGRYLIAGISLLLALCDLRVPVRAARHRHAVAHALHGRQSRRHGQDRGQAQRAQHHRQHHRNLRADVCDDPRRRHGGNVFDLLRCARGHRHRVLRVREEKERAGDRLRPFDRWTVLCPAVLQLRLLAERHHA